MTTSDERVRRAKARGEAKKKNLALNGKPRYEQQERSLTEVHDLLTRVLAVLHDISDALTKERTAPAPTPTAPAHQGGERDPLLSVEDVAEWLGVSASTLYGMRSRGRGPKGIRVGKRVRYKRSEIERWINERTGHTRPEAGTRPFSSAHLNQPKPTPKTLAGPQWCIGSYEEPAAASEYPGRGVCRVCSDHPLVMKNGTLRKHQSFYR